MKSLVSWLRQSTTVQGLAVAALASAAQLAGGAPLWIVLGGAAAAIVLLALPGQGDLSATVGKLVTDIGAAVVSRGTAVSVGILARDGLALAENLNPQTTVIPIVLPGHPPSEPPAKNEPECQVEHDTAGASP